MASFSFRADSSRRAGLLQVEDPPSPRLRRAPTFAEATVGRGPPSPGFDAASEEEEEVRASSPRLLQDKCLLALRAAETWMA
jgi:hypothetical protein